MRRSIWTGRDSEMTSCQDDALTTAAAPRWLQIADVLREEIASGQFAPGARLPNEMALAQRFGVHRHTLRQAIARLTREGHLRVVQGLGTFVRELVLDYTLQRRTRLTENLADAGERAERRLLSHDVIAAGAWGPALHLPPEAPVERLLTCALARGRPIGLSTTVYPAVRCAGIGDAFRRVGSITRALQAVGVADYQRARSTVSTRLPTLPEADALARAASEPVLVVQFVSIDAAGQPVEVGHTVFAADAVQLSVEHRA